MGCRATLGIVIGRALRPVLRGVGVALAAAAAGVTALQLSPRLVVKLVEVAFDRDNRRVARGMRAHVPEGSRSRLDVAYRPGDPAATLDVHRPPSATGPLPVVLWVHGGGWVSGDKNDVAPYLQILCLNSILPLAAVGLNYSKGPHGFYPMALRQIDAAFAYLDEHADELGLDLSRVVLAGDSAGAQLASQYAAMVTDRAFAAEVGIGAPTVRGTQLRGVVLHCGVYDLESFVSAPPVVRWGFRRVMWAWTGRLSISDNQAVRQMSTVRTATADFPPTLITGGNGDPLTPNQSRPFAARLAELGVPTTAIFFDDDHSPALLHEFQFDLDGTDGPLILARTVSFLSQRLS